MARIELINGATLVFDVELANDDDSPLLHSQFLDVIIYVYVVESKKLKFSLSDKYNRLIVVNESTLQVKCTPAMTKALGTGPARYSIHATVATGAGEKDAIIGDGTLIPLKYNPISDES